VEKIVIDRFRPHKSVGTDFATPTVAGLNFCVRENLPHVIRRWIISTRVT
jgi:hypothetical protein